MPAAAVHTGSPQRKRADRCLELTVAAGVAAEDAQNLPLRTIKAKPF
jgi:hypothetical protein